MLQYRVKIINCQPIDLFYTEIFDSKVVSSDKNSIHSYIDA